uniref:DEAD/DEAH box helicase n=1 Tax=Bordetella pertussis TaxID=520 RepID=UPI0035ABD00B
MPDVFRPLRRLAGARRGAVALSLRQGGGRRRRRHQRRPRVDIVIGTHKILSKDVRFKRLGLVIIDEEHRFGRAPEGNPQGAAAPRSTC